MVWLDLHAKSAPDTGTPSVEAHSSAVKCRENRVKINLHVKIQIDIPKGKPGMKHEKRLFMSIFFFYII